MIDVLLEISSRAHQGYWCSLSSLMAVIQTWSSGGSSIAAEWFSPAINRFATTRRGEMRSAMVKTICAEAIRGWRRALIIGDTGESGQRQQGHENVSRPLLSEFFNWDNASDLESRDEFVWTPWCE